MSNRLNLRYFIAIICAIVLTFTLLFSLCSCGNEDSNESQNTKTDADASIDLFSTQVDKIYSDFTKIGNDYISSSGSDDSLLTRFNQSMIGLLHAQKAVATADNSLVNDIEYNNKLQQSFVSKKKGWPRQLITISAGESNSAIKLFALKQDNVHENYKVYSYVKLFENTELPKFNTAGTGVDEVNIYDSTLKADITNTISAYADVLEKGAASEHSSQFLVDKLQSQIKTSHTDAESQLVDIGGSSNEVFRANSNNVLAIRSVDGGALVIAEIDSTWDRTGGGRIFATASSPAEKALFSGTSSTGSISVNYMNFVALYIPPKDVDVNIKVVGAERFPVAVVGH